MITLIVLGTLFLIAVWLIVASLFVVREKEVKIVEQLGKFSRVARPGLNFRVPIIEQVVGTLDLRIQSLEVEVETKTKDNVFTNIFIAVQAKVIEQSEAAAFYKLEDPVKQIRTFIYDVVRSEVPKMSLDELFEKKETISEAVQKSLKESMDDFGYSILKTLVTDINPAAGVRDAMNKMEASKRLKEVAANESAAAKIVKVTNAEAESAEKKLQGEGMAAQRKAIIDGLRESVEVFTKGTNVSASEVMNLVLTTQYFDMLRGVSEKGRVVLMPYSAGGAKQIGDEIRAAIVSANEVGKD